MHPGIRLLLDIGARGPDLLLTGPVLTDQGRVITAMMGAGWNTEHLRHVVTHRPLPDRVRTTVGAIIAARLCTAHAYPPHAASDSRHHGGDVPEDEAPVGPASARSSTEAASRALVAALAYRALVECYGCGAPATAPGQSLCRACLGCPLCRTCPWNEWVFDFIAADGVTPHEANSSKEVCLSPGYTLVHVLHRRRGQYL
ncbi:hypothetical protein [Streptomyces cadmiisoli]|uniref:Uncharacterized protein n=1 Tax=Streptomyces cadmiisoli TaxID=2184053 RepID=A0A2Z4IRI2_9ACTN|nr:hypothetical protein [Streptomyces cadmiisoli]AWW35435.1 hypothetical protein DN051_01000 [Streptomyces cadmiisoli]